MASLVIGEYLSCVCDRDSRTASDMKKMRQVLDLVGEIQKHHFIIDYSFREAPEGQYVFFFIEFETDEEVIEFKLKFL
jgi:hypothetical protein